jgi:hypothetical protein
VFDCPRFNECPIFHSTIAPEMRSKKTHASQSADSRSGSILDGKKPPRLINPEVWPAYRERFERIMGFAPEA